MNNKNKTIFTLSLTFAVLISVAAMTTGMGKAFLTDSYASKIDASVGGMDVTVSREFNGDKMLPGEIREYNVKYENQDKTASLIKNQLYVLNDLESELITKDNSHIKIYPSTASDADIKAGIAKPVKTEFVESVHLGKHNKDVKGLKFSSEELILNGSGVQADIIEGGSNTIKLSYKIYLDSETPYYLSGEDFHAVTTALGLQYRNSTDKDWVEVVENFEGV